MSDDANTLSRPQDLAFVPGTSADIRDTKPGASWQYVLATFLGSGLLFLIEPIAAKRILPLLGGSAAVWAACLVFFQAALLAGYLLAHALATRATPRLQRGAYLGLIVASIVQLALAITVRVNANPAFPVSSVLGLLALLIGLPFVTLSASGPLLQSWYARRTTASPYRLYVVSNVGSLLGLIIYPWLLEPNSSLRGQFTGLAAGMSVFVIMAAFVVARVPASPIATLPQATSSSRDALWTRLLWIALAACGSFLLSAVTSYISQNVATIPLLWIVPLVAYLLSFIIAFGNERWRPLSLVLIVGVVALSASAYRLFRGDLRMSVPAVVAIHAFALLGICLFCHDQLYRRRPSAERLTTFYFHLAAGGALGAVLVGVVAPLTLSGNYDLQIGLVFAAVLGVCCTWPVGELVRAISLVALIATCTLLYRDVKLSGGPSTIHQERNFYGTLRIDQTAVGNPPATVRTLQHGIIEHGRQVFREDLVNAPTTYYGKMSGVGLAVELCCPDRPRRIGVIGLGTGTMAAYGRAQDTIAFYDLNPAVEPIARRYFRYLAQSPAAIQVIDGDARVSLERQPPQRFDVIAVDAFSGDAIPVHLITTEALALYRRHLAPGGAIAFHVSNRYLYLAAVVQQLADDANMIALDIHSPDDPAHAVFSAEWVVMTDNAALASALALSADVETVRVPSGLRRWTDDYNSLLPILRVRRD